MLPQIILIVSPGTLFLILLAEVFFGASDARKKAEAERKKAEARKDPPPPIDWEAAEESYRAQQRLKLPPAEYEAFLEQRIAVCAYAAAHPRH